MKKSLTDLEAGTIALAGYAGKVITDTEAVYVKLLTDPTYNQPRERWEALAQVNNTLCMIEVSVH